MSPTETRAKSAEESDLLSVVSVFNNDVYSQPYEELSIKNDKYAGLCQELHLGSHGIDYIRDFEKFISLNTLWLNHNKIKNIIGLEQNFRIQKLYMHGNRLKKLNLGCFSPFKFLRTLTLNGNFLDDCDNVISELKGLRHLTHLDLFDNPIAQEDNYRLRILGELLYLEVLDRHEVSAEERKAASEFRIRMEKFSKLEITTKKKPRPTLDEEMAMNRRKHILADIINRLQYGVYAKRQFLENSFLKFDKRRLGHCDESIFWKIMNEFGLSALMNEEEKSILMLEFGGKGKVKTVKIEMPAGYIRNKSGVVHYRKFCEVILPAHLRLIPNLEYKIQPVPELSITTKDLEGYVKTVNKKKIESELLEKTRIQERNRESSSHSNSTGPKPIGLFSNEFGIDPWVISELNTIISNVESKVEDKDPTGKYKLFVEDNLRDLFKGMTLLRKIPLIGIKPAIQALLKSNKFDDGTVSALNVRQSLGCYIQGNKEQDTPVNNLVIKWRDLTVQELLKIEKKQSQKGEELLDQLLRSGPNDDIKDLTTKTFNTGIDTSRLGALKSFKKQQKDSSFLPSEIVKTASKRSDFFVLPNLHLDVKDIMMTRELSASLKLSQTIGEDGKRIMVSSIPPKIKGNYKSKGWGPETGTMVLAPSSK
jgi:non-ribosomal peptide synthetase component F